MSPVRGREGAGLRGPARRRPNTKFALRIARAQLKLMRSLMPGDMATHALRSQIRQAQDEKSPRFIQCWAVHRGYSSFTQALDETGQVWQLHTVGKKVDGVFVPEKMWWEPLDMTRKPVGAGSPSRADKTKEPA